LNLIKPPSSFFFYPEKVSWPPYWSVADWIAGFRRLLNTLEFERVHLFGAALGGFLAQKFAETHSAGRPVPRVASLVLCNTFLDTSIFGYRDASAL
jgi:maspardin